MFERLRGYCFRLVSAGVLDTLFVKLKSPAVCKILNFCTVRVSCFCYRDFRNGLFSGLGWGLEEPMLLFEGLNGSIVIFI